MRQVKKGRSTSPSGVILPQDLIFDEILMRLPLKSLHRFKFVSKHWNSFISSTAFYKLYLKRNGLTSTIVFMQIQRQPNFYTLKILHENHDNYNVNEIEFTKVNIPQESIGDEAADEVKSSNVIGSCNGLICLHLQPKNVFCVWNPITRGQLRINGPVGKTYRSGGILHSGFGYDSSSDQYKILLMYRKAVAYLFTSRDRKWKRLDTSQLERDLRNHRCISESSQGSYSERELPILVGDTLNWLVKSKAEQIIIFSLDLSTHCFTFSSLTYPCSPGMVLHPGHTISLCEIRQCLCARLRGSVLVWKLELNGKDVWKKLFYMNGLENVSYCDRLNYLYDNNLYELRDQTGRLLVPHRWKPGDAIVVHTSGDHPHRHVNDPTIETDESTFFSRTCGFSYTESIIWPFSNMQSMKKNKTKKRNSKL